MVLIILNFIFDGIEEGIAYSPSDYPSRLYCKVASTLEMNNNGCSFRTTLDEWKTVINLLCLCFSAVRLWDSFYIFTEGTLTSKLQFLNSVADNLLVLIYQENDDLVQVDLNRPSQMESSVLQCRQLSRLQWTPRRLTQCWRTNRLSSTIFGEAMAADEFERVFFVSHPYLFVVNSHNSSLSGENWLGGVPFLCLLCLILLLIWFAHCNLSKHSIYYRPITCFKQVDTAATLECWRLWRLLCWSWSEYELICTLLEKQTG